MKSFVKNQKILSFVLCLILATALCITGCSSDNDTRTKDTAQSSPVSTESTILGEGNTVFTFSVTDKEGNETSFEIHTDKETVGDALLELGLIEGDMGDFGLYVKTVNGITADYDTDQTYWAFYINDEYAMSGVDSTAVTAGEHYAFKVEK